MKKILFLSSFIFALACNTSYHVTTVDDSQQKFDANFTQQDAAIEKEIEPYRAELEASMNEVVVFCENDLIKAKPSSPLGNLLADATLAMAVEYTKSPVDAAIMNYGGIRVPSISKGAVTLGNVYEIMPFDNYLVTLELEGSILNEVLQKIASGGGWPVSGIQFIIKEGNAVAIKINGAPLDLNKTYTVAISDYLANGGDNLEMLKGLPQQNTNVLLRDAFIDYFREVSERGALLEANLENRIVNE